MGNVCGQHTVMPPAAAMAAWLPALLNARVFKAKQAHLFTSGTQGFAFMASIMRCRGMVLED